MHNDNSNSPHVDAQSESRLSGLKFWTPSDLLLDATSQNTGSTRSVEDVLTAVRACAELWDLQILQPYSNSTQNFVAPVISAVHGPAVLKVAFGEFMFERECLALRLFSGGGAVKVLQWDTSLRAMLLERASPGFPMVMDWDEQTEAFCGLLKALWRPAEEGMGLPSVAFEAEARLNDLAAAQSLFEQDWRPDRCNTIQRASQILKELVSSSNEQFVVHGDLHTENILSSYRSPWLSIDPIGCIGERAFDACSLLRDETIGLRTAADPRNMVERRLRAISANCNIDYYRLQAWSFVEAVRIQGWLYGIGMPTEEWSLLIPILEP